MAFANEVLPLPLSPHNNQCSFRFIVQFKSCNTGLCWYFKLRLVIWTTGCDISFVFINRCTKTWKMQRYYLYLCCFNRFHGSHCFSKRSTNNLYLMRTKCFVYCNQCSVVYTSIFTIIKVFTNQVGINLSHKIS